MVHIGGWPVRRALAVLFMGVLGLPVFVAVPAYADHGYYEDGGSDGNHGGNYGGNEREEQYGDNSCKYVCPAFDKSPVQDSFNLQICVMPGSCAAEEKPKEGSK